MITFRTEQTIARSPLDVWTYAADIRRHGEWMTVTDARVVSGDGTAAGARGRERVRLGPFRWDVEFEVAEAEPGRRIVWRGLGGAPFRMEVSLDLEPVAPASTHATYAGSIQMHGPWRLLAPLVAMEGSAGPTRELRRLKDMVESGRADMPSR